MPMKWLQFFHNGSNYDYNSLIKKRASNFEEIFECLRKNTEKYKKENLI